MRITAGIILASLALAGGASASIHSPPSPTTPVARSGEVGATPIKPSCMQPLFDRIFARTAAATACDGAPGAKTIGKVG